MHRKLVCTFVSAILLAQFVAAQPQWPTKTWPTATPRAEGIDANVLDRFGAEIAAGTFGLIDSLLVIRHG